MGTKTSNTGTLHNDAGAHVGIGGAEVELVDAVVVVIRLHINPATPADLFGIDDPPRIGRPKSMLNFLWLHKLPLLRR